MVADDRKYTQEHEWVIIAGDTGTVGVTDFAAGEMGDVVFLELPATGDTIAQGDAVGTIETVKSVEDLFTPLSGDIVEINDAVLEAPELLNQDPLDGGWLFKLRIADESEIGALLDAADYDALIGG